MSSSRQPEPVDASGVHPVGGQVRRPLSLRSKLIIAIVAVITVVCVSIGIVTQLFLNRYLTDQKDQQVEKTEPVNDENDTEGHSLQMLEYGRTVSQDRTREMERTAKEARMRPKRR